MPYMILVNMKIISEWMRWINRWRAYPAIHLWSLRTGHLGGGMLQGLGMTNNRAARQTEFFRPLWSLLTGQLVMRVVL
jgi:hypothetical protein